MKRVSILFVVVALIVGMVGCGDTTPSQNLEIRDWYDLDAIRDNLDGNYILMNNLDFTTAGYEELASPMASEGKGWEPIEGFYGTFDGQGHKICDLSINRSDEQHVGLFGFIGHEGVVENIGVVRADVTGNEYVGGLAGDNRGTVNNSYFSGNVNGGNWTVGGLVGHSAGTVSNSYSTGSITGNAGVGGLVGVSYGIVSNSYSTGDVIGIDTVGGLVGYAHDSTVSNSYSTSKVTGDMHVGGLVGGTWDGIVSDSYFTGSVTGNRSIGGLVGDNQGTVEDSYSTGNVTGNSGVGGLVGRNSESTVSNSYSTGNITGDEYVGGLVGWNYLSAVSNSFWDTETSGQATSDGGTGKTTAEMQDIDTFTDTETPGLYEPWDMIAVANPSIRNTSYIWNIVDGETYPFLSWQPVS